MTPTIPAPSPTPYPRGPAPGGVSHLPTHMADRSHTDAPAPDRRGVSTVLSSPPDHLVHRKPAQAACRQAAHVTDRQAARTTDRQAAPTTARQTVRMTVRERARPPGLRLAYPTGPGSSASRSWPTAAVIMPGRRLRTGPPPGCGTWSRSGMPPAPIPAADSLQRDATPTTPWLTTEEAGPVCAISRHCAGVTMTPSSLQAGYCTRPARAS